jgi:hypothetical protein
MSAGRDHRYGLHRLHINAAAAGVPFETAISRIQLWETRRRTNLESAYCDGLRSHRHRCEQVAVILEPESDEVLIGVALLRALVLALLVTRDEVLLLDQDSIDEFRNLDATALACGTA